MPERAARVVRVAWPLWLLALSLDGFFVYLVAFEAIDLRSSTTTAAYYAALCVCLLGAAWTRREVLAVRLRSRSRLARVCLGAGALLATWFVVNAATLSEGSLATNLVALLALWSLPTALLALSVRLEEIIYLVHGLIALGVLFICLEIVALVGAEADGTRFSPIATLDPISAGLVPALGAVSVLSLRPDSTRGRAAQLVIAAVLVAGSVLPGSRGPVAALLAAAAAVALTQPLPQKAMLPVSVALGLAAGAFAGSHAGSLSYLISTATAAPPAAVPALAPDVFSTGCDGPVPIPAAAVMPPDRLTIDGHAIHPDVTPERLTLGVHVSCAGKDVEGAAVLAIAEQTGQESAQAPEGATGEDGWAWVTLRNVAADDPAPQRLVVSVRARRAGEDVFTGVTGVSEFELMLPAGKGGAVGPR